MDPLVCQTSISDFCYFEQELPALVRFMCQHILVTLATLTAVNPYKTGPYGLPNQSIRFLLLRIGASGSCLICVPTHFGDSAGKLTISCHSSMKKGGSNINESDLDKNNIIKPTFDTLMEEDHKVVEAYHAEVDELFYSHDKVTW
jgi:hypothetical protein